MFPRVVSVEIVPGAACQLRLATDGTSSSRETDSRRADLERQIKELQATLDQVQTLAARSLRLMSRAPGPQNQGTLDLGGQAAGRPDPLRSRRYRRTE